MLNLQQVRAHFPALASDTVYFDNPGGTQVAQEVMSRIEHYLHFTNANHGGEFGTSRKSDDRCRGPASRRRLFARHSTGEIVFGPNMTTLTFHISRSLARTLSPGDDIVVTRLDHNANVAPW